MGTVRACTPTAAGRSHIIAPGGWDHQPSPGDSIAVNGCCLTVAECTRDHKGAALWRFDVITQTLNVTTLGSLVAGSRINLEASVTPATLLGGHLVQGHIDAMATVVSVQDDAEDWRIRLQPPPVRMDLMDMIVTRGSIALDGVSLTIAEADDVSFEVALIPETLDRTTLRSWRAGDAVNMEVDQIARTVVTYLRRHR
jgi:riboflavin synthase